MRAVRIRAAPASGARPGVAIHRAFREVRALDRARAHRALPREIERHIRANGPAARVRRQQRNLAHRRDRIRRVEHEAPHNHRRREHDVEHRRRVAGKIAAWQRTHPRSVVVVQTEIRNRARVVIAEKQLHAPDLARRRQSDPDPMPARARVAPPRITRAHDAIRRKLGIASRRRGICPRRLILRPVQTRRRCRGQTIGEHRTSGHRETCEEQQDEPPLPAASAGRVITAAKGSGRRAHESVLLRRIAHSLVDALGKRFLLRSRTEI